MWCLVGLACVGKILRRRASTEVDERYLATRQTNGAKDVALDHQRVLIKRDNTTKVLVAIAHLHLIAPGKVGRAKHDQSCKKGVQQIGPRMQVHQSAPVGIGCRFMARLRLMPYGIRKESLHGQNYCRCQCNANSAGIKGAAEQTVQSVNRQSKFAIEISRLLIEASLLEPIFGPPEPRNEWQLFIDVAQFPQ